MFVCARVCIESVWDEIDFFLQFLVFNLVDFFLFGLINKLTEIQLIAHTLVHKCEETLTRRLLNAFG
jgi:hypothetical protein